MSDSQKIVYTGLSDFGNAPLRLARRAVGNCICMLDSSCTAHGRDFYIESERSNVIFVAVLMKIQGKKGKKDFLHSQLEREIVTLIM